jgi:hypothetical protein
LKSSQDSSRLRYRPVEQDALALGVTDDPLAVAAELRVVRRQQQEPGEHAGAELVDGVAVAELALDVPVRRHRPEIHDSGVAPGRLDLGLGARHGERC